MVSEKEIRQRFKNRTSKILGVYTGKEGKFELKPKRDVYKLENAYGGLKLVKQDKGGTGERDLSPRLKPKEMEIFLQGLEQGVSIRQKRPISF